MLILVKFILLLCVPRGISWYYYQSWVGKRYEDWSNIPYIPDRLNKLMRVIYYGAGEKINDANGMRFHYEETKEYEIGYLIAEILERYERITMQMEILWKNDTHIYSGLDCVERIQQAYIEIFHIVNMIHEIPAKYDKVEKLVIPSDEEEDLLKPDDSAERDPIVIKNIQSAKHDFQNQEYWKGRMLKWKKRHLKLQSQLLNSGHIPQEYDPSDPSYNPVGGGKNFDEAYNMTTNSSKFYDPKLLQKYPYKHESKKSKMFEYGWDLPADWDF